MNRIGKRLLGIGLIATLLLATAFRADNNNSFEIAKNIELFVNTYKELNTYYVDELDPGKLMRTGIDAMLASLDPFTNYISESDIEGYRYRTEGKYSGIGAVSQVIRGYVTIIELYEDQPAVKAGLKVGDQIIAVDGKDAKGKTPEDVNEILRGFPGTEISLTIRRPGSAGDFDVKVTREEVNVPNVPFFSMVGDKVGYIALTTFTRDAGRNVANALKDLKIEHPDLQGVIFDLRGNGGGLLTEAVNVANVFIPKDELVVSTRGKVKEWDRSFSTLNTPVDTEIPLVVIIDKNSASASEIVSGVIQDYDRGVLIGQRSYGKGLVQNTLDVGYNSKVKLTTAKYYIPSGRCIQSVEYEDGEPVHIPDNLRQPFKTRTGRTVLDGGGVKPDVLLEEFSEHAVIQSLLKEHIVFDYVTEYCQKHEQIPDVEQFKFTEFDDFMAFLERRDFDFVTKSEEVLKTLKEAGEQDGYDLDAQIRSLENNLVTAKRKAILEHQEDLTKLIEKEIASRYYFQVGKIKTSLKNDEEITKAIALLKDKAAYQAVLTNN